MRHDYNSTPDPQVAAVDVLSQDWAGQGLYAFPTLRLVYRCISKLQTSNCQRIIEAPVWPSQPWFVSLKHHSHEEPRLLPLLHHLMCSHDGQVHPVLSMGLTHSSKRYN